MVSLSAKQLLYTVRSMKRDRELLDAWRDNDTAAGEELFARHFEALYRFFSRKVGSDADDLIQRTFMACVEGKERFRGEASFRTYLFGIARNILFAYWRRDYRAAALDFSVSSLVDLGRPSPLGEVAAKEEQRLLMEALRRIPLDLQIAIELYYWEAMSGPELATVLEIPEGTVRSRLRRAREELVAQLEALADSREILESTTSDLEGWARSLKGLVK